MTGTEYKFTKTQMIKAERVRELLDYDPDAGQMKWKVPRQGVKKLKAAGSVKSNGYMSISIDSRNYLMHRIVWLHVHGELPQGVIDHVNGVKSDNRIANLRVGTISLNNANRLLKAPKSGMRGVKARHDKWQATIRVNGKQKHLGTFLTKEEAFAAYQSAAAKSFGEFVHASVKRNAMPEQK